MKAVCNLFCAAAVAFLISGSLHAQITFEKWFGGSDGEYGYGVQQTVDGGYIIAGGTRSYGAGWVDVYLIKTDSLGDTLWTKTYGGTSFDEGNSVQLTADGGYIIAGRTRSYGAGNLDVYLIKTDASGDSSWTKPYGDTSDDWAETIQQTADGGYIIAGGTASYGAGGNDVYLIKTDTLGNAVWTKTYGGANNDEGYSVQQTIDGGYIIAGRTNSYGAGGYDIYLIKTDASGDSSWTKTYGDSSGNRGHSVQQTMDGGYVIAGLTGTYGSDSCDVYLVKTNASGDTSWTKTFGGPLYDLAFSVQQTSDGGYIITGFTESYGTAIDDLLLIKTDASGDTTWTKTFGGNSFDDGFSVQQTNDGGYVITGETDSYGVGVDVYLIKTDSLGNVGIQEEPDSRPEIKDIRLITEPNPFASRVQISLLGETVNPRNGELELQIHDVSGRRVKQISLLPFSSFLGATWDGCDENGNEVAPGIYFLKAGGKPVGKVVKVR